MTPEVAYLVGVFFELNSGRGEGMSGPLALSWADIKAWSELTGERLRPWQVRQVRVLDVEYLNAFGKAQAAQAPANGHRGR